MPWSWSWPKPVQTDARGRSGVPVLLGGLDGPKLFEHIIEYGSGWMPLGGAGFSTGLQRLRDLAATSGRDPAEIDVIPFGATTSHTTFDQMESLGVSAAVFSLPSGSRETVLPALDELATFVAQRRGSA